MKNQGYSLYIFYKFPYVIYGRKKNENEYDKK